MPTEDYATTLPHKQVATTMRAYTFCFCSCLVIAVAPATAQVQGLAPRERESIETLVANSVKSSLGKQVRLFVDVQNRIAPEATQSDTVAADRWAKKLGGMPVPRVRALRCDHGQPAQCRLPDGSALVSFTPIELNGDSAFVWVMVESIAALTRAFLLKSRG